MPRYAYPEDLSMAEAAASDLGLAWKAHVVNLHEAGGRDALKQGSERL